MTDLSLARISHLKPGRRWPGFGVAVPALVPLAICGLWWIASNRHWMSPQVLPTPALVWDTARDLADDNLWSNLGISLLRILAGLTLGVGIGGLLGLATGLSRRVEAIVMPTFLALVQIPTLAWVPLLMILLGLGEALKIVLIVKAIAVPVVIQTHLGVRNVDPRLIEAARVLRLSPLTQFRRLTLPAALPALLTGVRLGLAQGWTALVAVELLASSEGIGFLMVWGRQLFQLDVVFVCIIVIGTTGLAMDLLLRAIERRLLLWPAPAIAQHMNRTKVGSLWGWLLPAILLGTWSAASLTGSIDARILPAPWTVAATLQTGVIDGSIPSALVASLGRAFLGLAIGVGSGFLAGLALGLLPTLNRALTGTITVLRLVAIFAWLPLITAWVGLGDGAKVTFIAIACFFPMQLATERGVAGLSPRLIEAAKVLRFNPLQKLRYLVLPGAAPSIFAGIRLALVTSWIAAFGAEYFMAGNGIGSLMINAEQLFRTDIVSAGMIVVGVTAAVIAMFGRWLEAHATRWRSA